MNLSDFLKRRRTQKNLATAKEHYEELGGEVALGISLRHFQQIEAGKYPPSETLLAVLFANCKNSEKRDLVLAYFSSVFDHSAVAAPLLNYLEQYLSPAIETETKSLWESARRLMTYTEEQLTYLTENRESMRFHRRVMLLGEVKKQDCSLSTDRLKKLESLDLITVSANKIEPSRNLYRVPNYDNSGPRIVGKATDYILRHVELYGAREGSPDQELSYAMQMVSAPTAVRILEQMRAFKRWVQSLASTDTGPEMSPLLFVGLVRKIDRKEL